MYSLISIQKSLKQKNDIYKGHQFLMTFDIAVN